MARRNLLAEAQVQAQAQVAPQVYALQEALAQARADRNSAIHAAATSYKGLSGAIHRAGPQVRKNFSGAQRAAAGTDAITAPAIAGNATIAAAAAHEGRVGGRVIATRLAERLSELSDRRIAAAAGRAFQTGKAVADYSAASAKIGSQRQQLAAQEGLLTGANLSKLTEAQTQRAFTAHEDALQRQFQAGQSASDHAFTAHENALGRRSDRINAGINARSDAAKLAQQENFTAGQNKLDRQTRLKVAGMSGASGGGPKPTAATTFKGRQAIQAWTDQYAADGDMSKTAGAGRKKGVPSPILNAAADLHSKGYISPQGVAALQRMGIAVPKEWTPQVIRTHTRRRRSK